ncbi:hypothetical protein NDU88_007474 [Pleurodeles waltl]|uniref:Uncharacterized protein n=1 Tax=Pleurodeles waltl TaxID=8319 RepID=A0AAV7VTN4_PLEWA|nr:hypothetical protein NDU88_007474 [Pleurodeles waltl]
MSLRQPRPGARLTGTPRGNQPTRATLGRPPALRPPVNSRAPGSPSSPASWEIQIVRSGAEPKTPSAPGDRPWPSRAVSSWQAHWPAQAASRTPAPGGTVQATVRPDRRKPQQQGLKCPVKHFCSLVAATPPREAQQQDAPQDRKCMRLRRPRHAAKPRSLRAKETLRPATTRDPPSK